MTMQITEAKSFNFVIPAGEITFTFNIAAQSQNEAAGKILSAMQKAMEELKAMAKPGAN